MMSRVIAHVPLSAGEMAREGIYLCGVFVVGSVHESIQAPLPARAKACAALLACCNTCPSCLPRISCAT